MTTVITNTKSDNLRNKLKTLASKADSIEIAVAFLSDSELIKQWNTNKKKINVIVSLRPPTSFYSLKDLQSALNVDISFLGNEFHSKFFLFYKHKKLIGGIIGSSNFTSGGLVKNIETNIYINDNETLSELQKHFDNLLQNSNLLQPTDLDDYETIYKNWLARQVKENAELDKFKTKTTKNRTKRKQKVRITKEAKQYFEYWRIVDEIRDLVKDISDNAYPKIPHYLALDHFWHYVKVKWYKETGKTLNKNNQRQEIPKLFSKYIKWQREEEKQDYPKYMMKQSKNVFQVYLAEKNIDKLTQSQAKEIFQNLHSSEMPIQRFGSDDLFIAENDISKIRGALKYLLYSNDEMDLRIHNLMKNPKYKLHRLGSSGIQEINGWTRPTEYPIRNDKADKALEILGYKLD
ncbi:MAG: phospholipase D family protein [Synergistaceae bacterium]|jgi:HKD family nuclease|nr:phospholipase D family protein [Synergistaceae bacterium]